MPGTVVLDLEVGSIHLMSGKSFDIEEVCSREWIENDPIISRYIQSGYLELVHDSKVRVKKDPTAKSVPAAAPLEVLKNQDRRKVQGPNIIDMPEIVAPPKITKTIVEILTPEPDPNAKVEDKVVLEDPDADDAPDRAITFEDVLSKEEIEPVKSKGRRGRKPKKVEAECE